jgi:uncharacterized membrane protein YhiD involved in acid resistance
LDELIKESLRGVDVGGSFTFWHVVMALLTSFFLALILAYVYRVTHRGLSYSSSFVHAMIIMSVTVSLIMLIIGSNIARAFALVGALSIIRFRNAVKESRDVAFIFVAMAVGMAAGTGFYWAALVFTVFVSAMIYGLDKFRVGEVVSREALLRIETATDFPYEKEFEPVFYKYLVEHDLVSVEGVEEGVVELVFSVHLKKNVEVAALAEALQTTSGGRVTILTGRDKSAI